MSNLDSAHAAALEQPVIRPIRLAFFDFAGAPLRVTDCPYGVALTGTGDEDIDGFTFLPANTDLLAASDVQQNATGADTVTFTFSAMIDEDSVFMDEIGNVGTWRGRLVRLWRCQVNENFGMYGMPDPYFTGYMSVPKFHFGKDVATVEMAAESYLALFTQAPNRSYLSQPEYDPGDHSPELAIAIANGTDSSSVNNAAAAGITAAMAARGIVPGVGSYR